MKEHFSKEDRAFPETDMETPKAACKPENIALPQKGAGFRAAAAVSGRQRKDYPIPAKGGNHMKFRIPFG